MRRASTLPCSIEGCSRPLLCKGWCVLHYYRAKAHGGDPHGGNHRGRAPKFFEDALKYEGDDCLIWPFCRDANGYARLTIEGYSRVVSRIICQRIHGDPPTPDHQAAHSCGNGLGGCVTPGHLSWKTRKENLLDRYEHGTIKLAPADVIYIRKMAGVLSGHAMARQLGVTPQAISLVITRKTWPSITEADVVEVAA